MSLDERTRPWWTLAGTCAGLFLLMLDSTVVALALTEMGRELDASAAALQWVLNGYLLVMSVLVVTAGRLGDIYGRRLVFVAGLVVFGAGSVLAALAQDGEVMIAARLTQGAGAAAMLSLSLAIVSHAFPRERQAQALGIWAAVSAIGLAVGPLVGGLLIELDWRLIFWINLPLIAFGTVVVLVAADESRDESAERRIDLPGLITISLGLGALVLGIVQSDVWGWTAPHTLGLICGGLLLLGAFWAIEHRVDEPIVEFALFRNRPYLGATAAAFAVVGAYWSVMYFEPQYLQDVLGYSPAAAGALILPVTAPMVVISPLSARLIGRFGVRTLMTAGMVAGAAGLALLTAIGPESGYGALLPGYGLFGISIGCVYAPMSTAAMTAMPRAKAGIAAGVLAMNRVLAGAVMLAIAGAVFQSLLSDRVEAGESRDTAFSSALGDATWLLVALVALGAVVTWVLLRGAPAAAAVEPEDRIHHMHHRRFHL
jgi:EmrB/QacA subfamily drug resistance transporter